MMTSGGTLIDRRGHLAQLVVQALLAGLAFVTLSWVPLAAAALLFGFSALAWPRGAPVLRAWEVVARGRGPRWMDDGRPARISTALGAVNFAGMGAVVALGQDSPLLWGALPVLAAVLVAEAVVGACVPCELVVWASRRGYLRFRTPIGATR